MQQVLLNLITNAIEAMATVDGPRVLAVSSSLRGNGGVMISVADTGTGIDAQDVQRVFNPLFTTKSGGMGMVYCTPFSKLPLREWRGRDARLRMEIAGIVVGKPAVEGGEEGGRAGHSRSQTSSSFSVLRNRSVSALPLGLL